MRKPFTFSLVLTLTLLLSFSSEALAGDARWLALSHDDRVFVDRVAADLYQSELKRPHARDIEAETSRSYARGAPVDRARFREQRRDDWRRLDRRTQARLRNAKKPAWRSLTDRQKAPFRRQAMDRLGVAYPSSSGAPRRNL
ncbi:MAG: hypothetical protein AAGJ73_02355 [Pseudomonadota bacterium]